MAVQDPVNPSRSVARAQEAAINQGGVCPLSSLGSSGLAEHDHPADRPITFWGESASSQCRGSINTAPMLGAGKSWGTLAYALGSSQGSGSPDGSLPGSSSGHDVAPLAAARYDDDGHKFLSHCLGSSEDGSRQGSPTAPGSDAGSDAGATPKNGEQEVAGWSPMAQLMEVEQAAASPAKDIATMNTVELQLEAQVLAGLVDADPAMEGEPPRDDSDEFELEFVPGKLDDGDSGDDCDSGEEAGTEEALPKQETQWSPDMRCKAEGHSSSSTVEVSRSRALSFGLEVVASSGATAVHMRAYTEHMKACHDFKCNCPTAVHLHAGSCLEALTPMDLRNLHSGTFGVSGSSSVSRTDRRCRILTAYNRLEKVAIENDALGRCWRVTKWDVPDRKGDPVPLCHKGWVCAIGGSPTAHARMYALLLRGHSSSYVEGQAAAAGHKKLLLLAESAGNNRRNARRDYAVHWWLRLLRLQDYMPNDNKLVLRGPGYGFLHAEVYKPLANSTALPALSYKSFMSCVGPALALVGKELEVVHGDMDASKLRFGRSERHSKFAECTKCKTRRDRWLGALADPGTDPAVLKSCLDDVLEHQNEWTQVN